MLNRAPQHNFPWMILYAIVYQMVAGICLLITPEPIKTAVIGAFYAFSGNSRLFGAIFVLSALLAAVGMWGVGQNKRFVLCFVPQWLFVLIAGFFATTLAVSGHYADGTARPFLFIFVDQLPVIALTVTYSLSVIFHPKRKGAQS